MDVNKHFQAKQALQKDYLSSKEVFELHQEKERVMDQTITTLKRELHTQKQTYKMKQLSVVLKKRQTLFHFNQSQQ